LRDSKKDDQKVGKNLIGEGGKKQLFKRETLGGGRNSITSSEKIIGDEM